jgi:hypothetical protein
MCVCLHTRDLLKVQGVWVCVWVGASMWFVLPRIRRAEDAQHCEHRSLHACMV